MYGAVACILISIFAHAQSSLDVSSFVQTKNNHRLSGCIIKSQRTAGILECAHRCLSLGPCDSFNFCVTANQGSCELNQHSEGCRYTRNLIHKEGCVFGKFIIMTEGTFTFTTLGAVGREGPKNTSGYLGTSLEDKVVLNKGIQIWNVPHTGMYEIEARGACGGDGRDNKSFVKSGGLGARVRGHFNLANGTRLKILVGQRGVTVWNFEYIPGTGGGGSFVTKLNNDLLIVAGGGGGGSSKVAGAEDGDPGQAGRNGSQNGGVEGSGGRLVAADGAKLFGGAGGGFLKDGEGVVQPPTEGGYSFINGGEGGQSSTVVGGETDGGFGGGGASVSEPGGGGGYSGGGVTKTNNFCKAGGGGSYNSGTQQLNEAGINNGDGQVSIKIVN